MPFKNYEVMKNFNESKNQFEEFDFKIFNEKELSMVLGGGGDDQAFDFINNEFASDDDDEVC